MKPFQIFLIFFVTLILLLVLSIVFPHQGIKGIGGLMLRFPAPKELISSNDSAIADIEHIFERSEVLGKEVKKDTAVKPPPIQKEISKERIVTDTFREVDSTTVRQDDLEKLVYPITYPKNNPDVLYPFFMKLEQIKNSDHSLRVLHYGDSQIEGDRITSYVREKLQEKFGGYGPGLISPNMLVHHTLSVKQTASSNWNRFGVKDISNGIIEHDRLGIMMNYGRYLFPDTSVSMISPVQIAEIMVEPSGLGYERVNRLDRLKIYYGFNRTEVDFEMYDADSLIHREILLPERSLQVISVDNLYRINQFHFKFEGPDSPDIYAINLESRTGILVDNIPLRGSSGLDFSKSDSVILKKMLDDLNVGLVLLEFGVNVAPHIVKGYKWYENSLYRQLIFLKKLRPEMSILIMGISDLSRKVNGSYQSYPNIGAIRDAQKNAAFRAGCGFWDTFEAMGGENSMPGWVFADPPLARPDFVHFSNLGSKVIGEMFHNSLMAEYNKYLISKNEQAGK